MVVVGVNRSGLVVVLSLSSVPEATGSHVHIIRTCTFAAGVFRPNILSSDQSLFFQSLLHLF